MTTTAQMIQDQNRAMDRTLDRVESLSIGLVDWVSDIDSDGSGRGQQASDRARLLGRMVDQLLTMSTLIELSLRQRREQGDVTTSWILLEQARQQLGWAARTAGTLGGTVPEAEVITSEPERDAQFTDAEFADDQFIDDQFTDEEPPATAIVLEYLIHRDLIPRPEHASELMDMGSGVGVVPDPRPDTPLELVPLQMLSAAVMQCGSVISGAMPRHIVDRMTYGTYVATLLDEAGELLGEHAHATGQRQLGQLAEVVEDAAIMMWQSTPGPLEVFPPREGGPAAA